MPDKPSTEERARRAAEAALADHQYVSLIDVFTGMRLLERVHVEAWRKGRIDSLDEMLQGSAQKLAAAIDTFLRFAREKGLQPVVTEYVGRTRTGVRDLRFTKEGIPDIERLFRTHYVSPALSDRQRKKIEERTAKPPEPVVFEILRDSKCSECGVELPEDSLLFMDKGQPLCLACVQMDDLEYLPAGDTALTRRATKYSARRAVVVRFSRSRGRYERQGILVEQAALSKAEQECTEDAEERAAARARAAEARSEQDRELIGRMTARLRELFPGCPPKEAAAIARHTAVRGSGRVGRTAAGRDLQEAALTAAVAAAIRHNHTNYDELLASGLERGWARERVAERVTEILDAWRR